MKLLLTVSLAIGMFALAGCSVDLQTGGAYWGAPSSGSQIASGGAAGRLGRSYCQAVPENINERDRWNDVCFGTR